MEIFQNFLRRAALQSREVAEKDTQIVLRLPHIPTGFIAIGNPAPLRNFAGLEDRYANGDGKSKKITRVCSNRIRCDAGKVWEVKGLFGNSFQE